MTDIISAIDAATGCQQCGEPLGSSPSSDFCSEFCQGAWHFRVHHDGTLEMLVLPDTRALSEAFGRMSEALAGIMRGMSVSATRAAQAVDSLMESCEPHAARQSAMNKALEARRARNTGPSSTGRAPRSINPRRTR